MAKKILPLMEPIAGYRLLRYLGRGGFGEVWEAEAPGGLSKAVKLAPMEQNEETLQCRELEGLRKMRTIRHPYLLSIERFEVVEDFLVIVMELADMSLADRFRECVNQGLPGIPRDELLRYMREAAEVLDLMSDQHGLQHLDIKPENLFLSSGHVKVADFGLVQPRNTNLSRTAVVISPPYAPPELFDGRIEPTADQYSLAVTYQELLTGARPYQGSDVRGLVLQHLRNRPDVSRLPNGDRPVVVKALQRDPSKRFETCKDLVSALERAAAFGVPMERAAQELETRDINREGVKSVSRHVVKTTKVHLGSAPKEPEPEADSSLEQLTTRVTALDQKTTPIPAVRVEPTVDEPATDRVHATFLAFLPLEIFAHKLRGFIDAMEAEIVSCTNDKTVLRFGSRRWFGIRKSKSLFLELDTYARDPHSGFRIVDAVVWSSGGDPDVVTMGRRGMLLIRCLKCFLMATDSRAERLLKTDSQIREEIFG
ncbi:MAG: serine/threonine-protein kinase [Planctomycetota bacterium]